jgi:tetratricopeptide (TPR) repeat protein
MRQLAFISLALVTMAWAAPQNDEARKHFELGRGAYEAHDDSGESAAQAEAEFRRALELDPKFAPALAYLGFLAADNQKLQEAEDAYRRALAIDSRSAEAQLGMARLDLQAGRRPEALRKLRQAASDHPEHPLILSDLAFTLTAETSHPTREAWDEAIRCWQVLLKLDKDNRDAHQQLAEAFEHEQRWADAESHYREVLRIGQTDEDMDVWVYSVHTSVAKMLERQGKYQEAIREYEAFIASEGPGDQEIRDAKARIEVLKNIK